MPDSRSEMINFVNRGTMKLAGRNKINQTIIIIVINKY